MVAVSSFCLHASYRLSRDSGTELDQNNQTKWQINLFITGDGICGTEVVAPNQMIESDQTRMLLVFTSQGPTKVPYRGFHLRFTEFHPGKSPLENAITNTKPPILRANPYPHEAFCNF
jgi:hypothetical protein